MTTKRRSTAKKAAPKTTAPPSPAFKVLPDSLHVFGFPGINAPIIGAVNFEDLVEIHNVSGPEVWIQITENPDRWILHSYNGQQFLEKKK